MVEVLLVASADAVEMLEDVSSWRTENKKPFMYCN